MQTLTTYRRKLDKLLLQVDHARQRLLEEQQILRQAKEKVEYALQAQKLVQEVAEQVQISAYKQIASVVTRCLQTVFGENSYEFRIIFEKKRGKTEARLVFCRDSQEIDPLEAAGGGAVDVASFSLRLAALVLSRPKQRLFLCLDEPFRFLSKEYRPTMRKLLLVLSKETGIQIVMITHAADLVVGKVVHLGAEE